MPVNLTEIKKCKKCNSPILLGSDDYCEYCKKEMHKEKYKHLLDAENSLENDTHWLKNYSAWKSTVLLPIVIMVLLIIFYIISAVTDIAK